MVTIRKPKNALKFSKPASWWGSVWREALPAGNGVIGASVYGGVGEDVIMINHSDLWWQGYVGVLQDVADKVKDTRKKMDENAFRDAEHLLSNALVTKGYRPLQAYPLPLCDFKVRTKTDKQAKEYARILNMENGEVSVTYKDGNTRFDRSMFVSREDNLICYEITRTGAKNIDVDFSLEVHERFNARTLNAVSKLPDGVNIKYENYFMYFSARSDNGTDYGAVAFINHYGGSQTVNRDSISIKGAEKVVVYIKPFIESQREKEWKAIKPTLSSIKATYDKLIKEHTKLHNKLFNTAELDLDASDKDERDMFVNDLLAETFETGEVPHALLEKLWAYGRYLLICGSTDASLPCPPNGLWCGDYKGEGTHINAAGSLQNMYNHVLTGNLNEYLLSVFSYYENVIDDLRKNASRLYAVRGIFVPSVMARGTGVLGSVESDVIHFTGVAGWISQMFYDYYLYTNDVKFLKNRALPFMREAAMFYENFFKVQPDNTYETCPSYSPNTSPQGYTVENEPLLIARNATIDFAIAKELFENLIEGSEIANMNKTEIPKWKDMLTRIPNYKINDDITVSEYIDDKFIDNINSASTSVFYGVYPSTQVNVKMPELKKAFDNTAKKRLANSVKDQTSMTLSRYANIFARLGDGNQAADIIASIVRGMAMENLVFASTDWRGMGIGKTDIWSSYTIEPNMGITSAVQEMILQSDKETLFLLPALTDTMVKGEVNGLLTRVGAEVTSITWDRKKGICVAKIKAKRNCTISVSLPNGTKKVKPIGQETINYESGMIENLSLPANKVVTLDIKF